MKNEWSKEVFSKNLQFYMEQSGRTQKELAEIMGVSAPTFHDWVKGKKFPRIDKVQKLADYFGVLKSDLIEAKEEKQEKEKPINVDGLTENHQKLLSFASTLSEEQAGKVLQLMKSILAFDE